MVYDNSIFTRSFYKFMKPYEITLRLLIIAENETEAREIFEDRLQEHDYNDVDVEIEEA
jgi:hypothetical protein